MTEELHGYDAKKKRLRQRYSQLEAERVKLADLPAGAVDPAERQR